MKKLFTEPILLGSEIIVQMFTPRATKEEKPDTGPYTYHLIRGTHTGEGCYLPYRIVVTIDPGRKNFGFRIEKRESNGVVVPLAYVRTSFVESSPETLYYDIYRFLNQYYKVWNEVTSVVVERQLPINYKTGRIAQHVISYFTMVLSQNKHNSVIFEVNAFLKGKMFGGPKGKIELKKWSSPTAIAIFKEQNDWWSISIIEEEKKKDDIGDAKIQLEALIKQLRNEASSLLSFILP